MNKINNSFLSPDDKNSFARWLLSLKRYELVKEVFNGYEFRSEFKTPNELYDEWYNDIRKDSKTCYEYSNGF
jgi:hypothetical protein